MSSEHAHPVHQKPKSVIVTFILGFVGFLLFSGMTIALFFIGYQPSEDYDAIRGRERLELLTQIRTDASARLASAGWVDQAKGIAHIPVQRALELALVELPQKPIVPSSVEVPPPLPVVDPNAPAPVAPVDAATPAEGATEPAIESETDAAAAPVGEAASEPATEEVAAPE